MRLQSYVIHMYVQKYEMRCLTQELRNHKNAFECKITYLNRKYPQKILDKMCERKIPSKEPSKTKEKKHCCPENWFSVILRPSEELSSVKYSLHVKHTADIHCLRRWWHTFTKKRKKQTNKWERIHKVSIGPTLKPDYIRIAWNICHARSWVNSTVWLVNVTDDKINLQALAEREF